MNAVDKDRQEAMAMRTTAIGKRRWRSAWNEAAAWSGGVGGMRQANGGGVTAMAMANVRQEAIECDNGGGNGGGV
jgi:hypothetical protein